MFLLPMISGFFGLVLGMCLMIVGRERGWRLKKLFTVLTVTSVSTVGCGLLLALLFDSI